MSIPAAVAELNKEIAALDRAITEAERKKARLVGVRDSLLKEDSESDAPVVRRKPGRKLVAGRKSTAARKAAFTKKTVAAKKVAAPKKRVMSAEAKKKIADAQRKRWAAHKAAAKTA